MQPLWFYASKWMWDLHTIWTLRELQGVSKKYIATRWPLRFSKLKKKWLRKWCLKLPTPLQKSAEFTAHNMHSFDVPLHFHDLQWKQNLFHTLVEGKVRVVLYPWLGGGVNIDRSKLSWFHLTQHSLAHLVNQQQIQTRPALPLTSSTYR